MKKILYLLSSLMLVFTACDPMEDVYEELDKTAGTPKKTLAITLQEADYKGIKDAPANVKTGLYFTTEVQASEFIPTYLNTKYAHLNNKDVIDVTYNMLVHAAGKAVSERIVYTLVDADYALGGTTFKNFDRWSQIETFLNAKYPEAKEGRMATLTFTWFNTNAAYPKPDGSGTSQSTTLTDTYYYSGGKWYDTYMVTDADYASVERNRNNAFTSADEVEYVAAALDKFLKAKIMGAKAGDVQYASYLVRYSSSSTLREVMPMVFDGTNWKRATKAVTKEAMLSFKKKEGVWVADPVIKYTLTTADYIWIGDNPALGTADNRANLKDFKSFYQRFSDDKRYWTQAQVIAAIGALLKERFPAAEVGNKFEVTYVVHTGPTGPTTLLLELKDTGNYEVPVE